MHPEEIDHPVLGSLKLDPLAGWYSSAQPGYELTIDFSYDEPLEQTLIEAVEVFTKAKTLAEPAKLFASRTLIKDLNLFWRTIRPITTKVFIRKLALRRIMIRYDRADFEFDDGGMFSGHPIIVESEDDQSFSDAYFEG